MVAEKDVELDVLVLVDQVVEALEVKATIQVLLQQLTLAVAVVEAEVILLQVAEPVAQES